MAYWERALAAVLFSAIFDALDGRAARLLRVTSKFGAVLDSLSDFVSFGVAPAVILHQRTLSHLINDAGPGGANIFALIAVTTYALCAGLRRWRFTSAAPPPKPSQSNYFVGMPTPAAAGAVLIPPLLDVSKTFNYAIPDWAVVIYTWDRVPDDQPHPDVRGSRSCGSPPRRWPRCSRLVGAARHFYDARPMADNLDHLQATCSRSLPPCSCGVA